MRNHLCCSALVLLTVNVSTPKVTYGLWSVLFFWFIYSVIIVFLCVCCRCLAVVGLHRCSVGGGMGARVISVLQESSRARWDYSKSTKIFIYFLTPKLTEQSFSSCFNGFSPKHRFELFTVGRFFIIKFRQYKWWIGCINLKIKTLNLQVPPGPKFETTDTKEFIVKVIVKRQKKCLSRLENWLYLLSSPTLLSIMRSVFLGLWPNPQSNREGRMWRLSNRNLLRCVQLRAVPSACLLRAPGSKGLRRRHYNVGCHMWRLSVRVRIVRLSGLWVHWGLRFFFVPVKLVNLFMCILNLVL